MRSGIVAAPYSDGQDRSLEARCPNVRVHNFSVSLDGYAAGEGQTLEAPFGHAGPRLMQWAFGTRTFQKMFGEAGGSAGLDEAFASDWARGVGVEIMGRNKFGPHRGPWADEEWKGWWGDDPVFPHPGHRP